MGGVNQLATAPARGATQPNSPFWTADEVPGIDDAMDLAVGVNNTCVIAADATVDCLGYDSQYPFDPVDPPPHEALIVPTQIVGLSPTSAFAMSRGHSRTITTGAAAGR